MDPRYDVELVDVTKRYGGSVAVDNVSLRIQKASYCCLLGPSGCGKTSTLRMIAGHETISEGDILIDGENVGDKPPLARGTAMMFQSYALFSAPHLPGQCRLQPEDARRGEGRAAQAGAREYLDLVHMTPFVRPAAGPAFRRAAAARGRWRGALINRPKVLLLDEPLSALDPFLRIKVREELKRLQRDLAITFIHVTHSQDEAMALADLMVVMEDGQIRQCRYAARRIRAARKRLRGTLHWGPQRADRHRRHGGRAGRPLPAWKAQRRVAGPGDRGGISGHVWCGWRWLWRMAARRPVLLPDDAFYATPVAAGAAAGLVWSQGDAHQLAA